MTLSVGYGLDFNTDSVFLLNVNIQDCIYSWVKCLINKEEKTLTII